MKKLLIIALLLIGMTATAQQRDANGNYRAKATMVQDSTTQFIYTDSKGKVYPVYRGRKGGLYVIKVRERTLLCSDCGGTTYKMYLKK